MISQPHFYEGSHRYINAIEGLHPGSEHSTIVDVEPVSGPRRMTCPEIAFYVVEFCEIALSKMPTGLVDYNSTLVQIMAW